MTLEPTSQTSRSFTHNGATKCRSGSAGIGVTTPVAMSTRATAPSTRSGRTTMPRFVGRRAIGAGRAVETARARVARERLHARGAGTETWGPCVGSEVVAIEVARAHEPRRARLAHPELRNEEPRALERVANPVIERAPERFEVRLAGGPAGAGDVHGAFVEQADELVHAGDAHRGLGTIGFGVGAGGAEVAAEGLGDRGFGFGGRWGEGGWRCGGWGCGRGRWRWGGGLLGAWFRAGGEEEGCEEASAAPGDPRRVRGDSRGALRVVWARWARGRGSCRRPMLLACP